MTRPSARGSRARRRGGSRPARRRPRRRARGRSAAARRASRRRRARRGASAARPSGDAPPRAATGLDDSGIGRPTARYFSPCRPRGSARNTRSRKRRGEPVRETEMRVRLGQRAGDPLDAGRRAPSVRRRSRRLRARRRAAATKDRAARGRRGERPSCSAHELGVRTPRETGDGEGVELVAPLRYEPRLDAIRRPGERHQTAPPPQHLRDCERRRDVSDRPARRDQAPKLLARPPSRAMLRRIADRRASPRGSSRRRRRTAAGFRSAGRRRWRRRC